MKSIEIAGVQCSLNNDRTKAGELILETPSFFSGNKLRTWLRKHKEEAIESLTHFEFNGTSYKVANGILFEFGSKTWGLSDINPNDLVYNEAVAHGFTHNVSDNLIDNGFHTH